MRKSLPCLALMLALFLVGFAPQASAWSNGGYSSDPYDPDYGTHDYLLEHALNMLPTAEKNAIIHSLSLALYGTEMPDNPDEIYDQYNHHVYYSSEGQLTDDKAADRAKEEYDLALEYLQDGDYTNADKRIGAMSHYITDLAVFGHVMGAYTDWGAEVHHSDYESYVQNRTTSYTSSTFDSYIVYDGSLTGMSAYSAATGIAYAITFGSGDIKSCTWMDSNYSWSNSTFKDSCGASMNLAVNYLAEVLHQLYLDYSAPNNAPTLNSGGVSPASGGPGTTFTYEVTYADADGDAPSYVRACIDGVQYSMTKISGAYTSGALYRYATSALGAGSHDYYFSASDGTDAARLPSSDNYSGPTVAEAANQAPALTSGSVDPTSGTPDNTFTYEVTYTDADGDAPSYVQVHIDGSAHAMSEVSGTYTSGALYRCATSALDAGPHTYHFSASDGTDAARLPSSDNYSGPTVAEAENENVPPTVAPFVTLTFRKPDGTPLANTEIVYGLSSDQATCHLGTTDSQGEITSDNSDLGGREVYFRSSDGRYAGSAYVSSTGGDVSSTLTETTAPGASEFPAWAAAAVVVTFAVVAAILIKRRRGGEEPEAPEGPEGPSPPPIGGPPIPPIKMH